jgi:hypothetical protein
MKPGGVLKLPQRVRAELGRQVLFTHFILTKTPLRFELCRRRSGGE